VQKNRRVERNVDVVQATVLHAVTQHVKIFQQRRLEKPQKKDQPSSAERNRKGLCSADATVNTLTHGLLPAVIQPYEATLYHYRGLHLHNPCKYMDYYSLPIQKGWKAELA